MNERQKAIKAMQSMIKSFERHFSGRSMPTNSQNLLEVMENRLIKANDETLPVQIVEVRDFYRAL